MEVLKTEIPGLLIIQPRVFFDDRGYFMETYSKTTWNKLGLDLDFVQDNESCSNKGVLRGLHFQTPPCAQDKIVRVIKGAVWDVAVDIRKNSPTYGRWVGIELNEENKTQFLLPAGMAHGFLTLKDDTIFAYKVSSPYSPENDSGLLWDDKILSIDWPIDKYGIDSLLVSEKDKNHTAFKNFATPFVFNER